MSRAFPTATPNISSGDRSKILRQQTIYNNIRENIAKDVCQTKGNKFGSVNYCLSTKTVADPLHHDSKDCDPDTTSYTITEAKIRSTSDYETLLDISKGKAYCNPCNILLNRFDGSNGESSNTLYINPDQVTIASTANNYCGGAKGHLPCCDSDSVIDFGENDKVGDQELGKEPVLVLPQSCDQCSGKGMIYKENEVGDKDKEGFISVPCFACDKTCEATNVIIDPYHTTFRANCNSSFMGTDKPGPWVNRIRTANPSVMSQYNLNGYRRGLTGFRAPKPLDVSIYPENSISLQNCTRFPEYNGIYLLDNDRYKVMTESKPITSTGFTSADLVYSQWVQVDALGKLTGRTIIPCIGTPSGTNTPCVFSYVISMANLRCKNNPFNQQGHPHSKWKDWTPGDLIGNLARGIFSSFYVTNFFRFDASGFIPFIVRTPHPNGVNEKSTSAVVSDWNRTGIADLLVDQPIANTFSAQYPVSMGSLTTPSPFGEDIITMKTITQ